MLRQWQWNWGVYGNACVVWHMYDMGYFLMSARSIQKAKSAFGNTTYSRTDLTFPVLFNSTSDMCLSVLAFSFDHQCSGYYWVERKVFAFSKRWRLQTKTFLQGRNWKACDTLGDGNSKQWKLYNWLNIVNVFKKMIDFSFEKRKNFPFNPIIYWFSVTFF
jgi:hypothetical protein